MKNTKLIICDLDGTLVEKHKPISNKTKEVIKKANEQGIYFGLASGRPLDDLEFKETWGLEKDFDVIVGLNGCQLKDNILNKTNTYYKMKKEWIKETFEIMKPFSYNPMIYVEGAILCGQLSNSIEKSAKNSNKKILIAKNQEEFYKEDNYKIMFRVSEEDMIEIEKYLSKLNLKHIKSFKTQTTLIEFASSEVDKSLTINEFCKNHDILIKDVVCFGDTTNDNGMLKWAGTGVCMSNGSDDTKAISDYICDSVENDGVAKFIEENILKAD